MSTKVMEIKELMKLGKLSTQSEAEDIYMNLSMKFKSFKDGLSKVKIIMKQYNLPLKSAVDCALDPSQLEILKTMSKK